MLSQNFNWVFNAENFFNRYSTKFIDQVALKFGSFEKMVEVALALKDPMCACSNKERNEAISVLAELYFLNKKELEVLSELVKVTLQLPCVDGVRVNEAAYDFRKDGNIIIADIYVCLTKMNGRS